jgi:hypothetical protein
MKNLLFLIAFCFSFSASATTWPEPWQKDIIQSADHFVYAEVVSCVDSSMEVKVLKSFGNDGLEGKTLHVDGFYLLVLCSYSEGHGAEFEYAAGDRGYLMLKAGDKGNYGLPTPTSGFDRIVDGKVYATYRHTYHQALMDSTDYELTYTEIWKYYKTGSYDREKILAFIHAQLSSPPAGFGEEEIGTFFKQHAALETAYLLDISLELNEVMPFMKIDNFHSHISALRAMQHIKTKETGDFLLKHIADKEVGEFEKVIAIWSLQAMGTKEQKTELRKLAKKLPDESVHFGSNLMDPRICTSLPSPKEAAEGEE